MTFLLGELVSTLLSLARGSETPVTLHGENPSHFIWAWVRCFIPLFCLLLAAHRSYSFMWEMLLRRVKKKIICNLSILNELFQTESSTALERCWFVLWSNRFFPHSREEVSVALNKTDWNLVLGNISVICGIRLHTLSYSLDIVISSYSNCSICSDTCLYPLSPYI